MRESFACLSPFLHPPPCPLRPLQTVIQEVLPKAGLVYSEKGNLSEVLCKPKIMPIKSVALERLETLEKEAGRAPTAAVDMMSMPGAPSPDDF